MKNRIMIIFLSLILGIVLSFQYRVVQNNVGNTIITQKASELYSELKNVNEQRNQLMSDLNDLEDKIKEYENRAAEENTYIKNLTEEIQKYKIMAGYSDVSGPGVIITLDNPPDDMSFSEFNSNLIYNYEYILLVISNLNAAGAEAISVNGQRFTNYTELVPVGNSLNVNGISVIPPIEIKAIGNKQTLESVLNFKGGVIWELRNLNFKVLIETKDKIEIERQIKKFEFKYARPYKN